MTEGPVVKDFVYGTSPFCLWCKANSEAIIRKWPDVKERGLIIVTSVYTTRFAMINAGSGTEKEISIGFRAGTIPIGEVGSSSSWCTAQDDNGWVVSEASKSQRKESGLLRGFVFQVSKISGCTASAVCFQYRGFD